MKKYLLLAIVAMEIYSPAFSQTEKGGKMIGGNVYLTTSARQGSNYLEFGLFPQLGFFLADNLALGPGFSFSASSSGDYRSLGYGLAPFARYYFGSSLARPFLTGSAGISGNRITYQDNLQTNTATHFRVGPGVTYFLNEAVGLEGVLTYDISHFRGEPASRTLNLHLGVQVFLPRRQR